MSLAPPSAIYGSRLRKIIGNSSWTFPDHQAAYRLESRFQRRGQRVAVLAHQVSASGRRSRRTGRLARIAEHVADARHGARHMAAHSAALSVAASR
jgi:hypothetical protein